jgi:hypothetical protein
MRTETKTTKIFKFSELTEKAKQAAIEDWRANTYEYDGADEWLETMEVFCDRLSIALGNYSVGPYSRDKFIDWELPYDYTEESFDSMTPLRLRTWIINNILPYFKSFKYLGHLKRKEWTPVYSKLQYCYDEMSLTGFTGDYSLVKPFLDFVAKPDNQSLEDIFYQCKEGFISDWVSDMEAQDEDDYIIDAIEANEYEFLEDGSRY